MRRIQVGLLTFWIVGYVIVMHWCCAPPPRPGYLPMEIVLRTITDSPSSPIIVKTVWTDLTAANQFIRQFGGLPLCSEEFHLIRSSPAHPVLRSLRLHTSFTFPRRGFYLVLNNLPRRIGWWEQTTVYHELYHWAVNTQPEPLRTVSLFWRRAASLWLIPLAMLTIWPRFRRLFVQRRRPIWLARLDCALLFIVLVCIGFRVLDPEEKLANYHAYRAWLERWPPIIAAAFEKSVAEAPQLDTAGHLVLPDTTNAAEKRQLALWATFAGLRWTADLLGQPLIWLTGWLICHLFFLGWPRHRTSRFDPVVSRTLTLALILLLLHINRVTLVTGWQNAGLYFLGAALPTPPPQ